MKEPVKLQPPSNLQVVTERASEHPARNYANWMMECYEELKDKLLEQICLPGTHDSVSANLEARFTDERADPPKWVRAILPTNPHSPIAAAMLGTARATTRDIASQLSSGVRAFDFRVWAEVSSHGPIEYYGVHSFRGQNYRIIVNQLRDFLERYKGEVLYARFRFYDQNHLEGADRIQPFFTWVTNELRPYLVTMAEGNPFEVSYGALVDNGRRSRIIVEFCDESWRQLDVSHWQARPLFFTKKDTGLEGDTDGNGTSVETIIANQRKRHEEAKQQNLRFALWTPVVDKDKEIWSIVSAVLDCGNNLWVGIVPPPPIWAKNETELAKDPRWNSLHESTKTINSRLGEIFDAFTGRRVCSVFVDFFEETRLVDLAIDRSTGLARARSHGGKARFSAAEEQDFTRDKSPITPN
jgi:hypothetical protein